MSEGTGSLAPALSGRRQPLLEGTARGGLPPTGAPSGGPLVCRVKVAVVIVAGFIALLKVALTAVCGQTLVARSAGLTVVTVGGMESGPAPVVKVQM